MGMRARINSAVAEGAERHAAGLLPWTSKTVQSLITPCPRRVYLDELKIGQADEATADPDGVPWGTDEARTEQAEAEESADDGADDHDAESVGFDPADWVDPDEAAGAFPTTKDAPNSHGDGDEEKRAAQAVFLDDQQVEHVIQESSRMRSLQEALHIFRNMNNQVGASLASAVTHVLATETRRHKAFSHGDALVHYDLQAALKDEEAQARRARLAFQEHRAQEKEKTRVKRELHEATGRLKKIREEQKEAQAV
eukprot:8849946-Pyramimonas_sp.AAC.1